MHNCVLHDLDSFRGSHQAHTKSINDIAPLPTYFIGSDVYCCTSECMHLKFIIHPCDPTVVICYLIQPCDIAVCITYLISHSYSLTYNLRIFQFGCIINTKLSSCDDIIRHTCTSLGFPRWCSESTHPTDSCFQGTSWKNLMLYGRLYQHIRMVLYIYIYIYIYIYYKIIRAMHIICKSYLLHVRLHLTF